MSQQFNLHISIGNAAMSTGEDLADALRRIAVALADDDDVTEMRARQKVRDVNGNTVGEWTIGDLTKDLLKTPSYRGPVETGL